MPGKTIGGVFMWEGEEPLTKAQIKKLQKVGYRKIIKDLRASYAEWKRTHNPSGLAVIERADDGIGITRKGTLYAKSSLLTTMDKLGIY